MSSLPFISICLAFPLPNDFPVPSSSRCSSKDVGRWKSIGEKMILGERNNESLGLSLNPEESFPIVGIVTHFVESHHQKVCTNISHFDLLYLL